MTEKPMETAGGTADRNGLWSLGGWSPTSVAGLTEAAARLLPADRDPV